MKKRYWLKLYHGFLDTKEIAVLEGEQDGHAYIVLWLKILLLCLDKEESECGFLRLNEKIPYTPDMLARVTRESEAIVEAGIRRFISLGMMEILDNGTYYIEAVQRMIGKEELSTDRVREHRARKKALEETQNTTNLPVKQMEQMKHVTKLHCNAIRDRVDIDIEKDIQCSNANSLSCSSCDEPVKKPQKFSEAFEQFYAQYPRKVGKKLAMKAFAARMREGCKYEELVQALDGYKKYLLENKTEKEFILHPSTFLGPNERWSDYIGYLPENEQAEYDKKTKEREKIEQQKAFSKNAEELERKEKEKKIEQGKARMRAEGKTEKEIAMHYAWYKEAKSDTESM